MKYKYDANYCSSSWTKLLALYFHGKAFIHDGGPGRGCICLVQADYRCVCINGTCKKSLARTLHLKAMGHDIRPRSQRHDFTALLKLCIAVYMYSTAQIQGIMRLPRSKKIKRVQVSFKPRLALVSTAFTPRFDRRLRNY